MFFGESRFLGRGYYGGHFGDEQRQPLRALQRERHGLHRHPLRVRHDAGRRRAGWADDLRQNHSDDRRAIAVSHWMVNTGNPATLLLGRMGQAVYDTLKVYPNLFLMLAGTSCRPGHRVREGRRPRHVRRQRRPLAALRLPVPDERRQRLAAHHALLPAGRQIEVRTYSPTLGQFEADDTASSRSHYQMGGAPFRAHRPRTNVPSAASPTTATTVWQNLDPESEYEWYVSVSDGGRTTTGPVWSFTTALRAASATRRSATTATPAPLTAASATPAYMTSTPPPATTTTPAR